MDYLLTYKLWLQNKQYSSATIRNYLVDLGKYLAFVNLTDANTSPFSSNIIIQYVTSLADNTNTGRYLASLNQFCLFAIDQNLISQNPLRPILKKIQSSSQKQNNPNLDNLLKLYQQKLISRKTSPITIRNYINDIRQYINWLNITKLES